jgi:hypothetical protein
MKDSIEVLVVEKASGEVEILPAQQNRIRDQLFTQSLGRRLIKRCPLKEAEALARQAQPSSLGRWEQTRGRLQR